MGGWEMAVFVTMTAGAVAIVTGAAWFMQWRRNRAAFRDGFRRSPPPGGANHWNRPR